MALFIPVISGIASILTVALTYETGKNAKKKFDKKRKKHERDRLRE